jgi:uncharacterized protein (TIGR03089 family)
VLLGAWWCGATVTTSAAGAAVALCGVDRVADAEGADELAAVALDALGMGLAVLPSGVRDFATEIRVHGDTFQSGGAGPDTETVLSAGRARAKALGLATGDRLLCTANWDSTVPGELLIAVLAADASLVQCTGVDLAALPHRCATERVTVTFGVEVPSMRRAG